MRDIRGDIEKYEKLDVAVEYLNLALSEYVKGQNLFAVLNLAGAAEEMLGKIVELNSKKNAHTQAFKLFRSWYQIAKKAIPKDHILSSLIVKAKNGVKHINGNADLTIELDIKKEAKETIRKALVNFHQIPELKNTTAILAYYQHEKA
jgi:hypothetical protein